MNKFLKFMPVAVLATMALAASSCSDNNDEPAAGSTPGGETVKVDPKTVFTQGVPKEVGDMVITTNAEGLVSKIVIDQDEVTTFDYTGASNAKSRANLSIPDDYDMTMTVDNDFIFYIKLNKMGYIAYAYEVEIGNGDIDEWWFDYNDKGQLIQMKRTEGYNEITKMTYNAAGDITNVTVSDDTGNDSQCTIAYTNADHPTPIDNKSGIMLYDYSLRIDMDEMAPAFFAGILGKATAHLPLSAVEVQDETDTYAFTWTLNANQMPTIFKSECLNPYNSYTDTINLKW